MIAATLAVIALVVVASPAEAEVATCGTRAASNYHAGYLLAGDVAAEGTYAQIVTRYGAVCDTVTSSANFTNQYALIASHDLTGWAQAGYLRWYGSSTYLFAQQSSGSTLNTKYGPTALNAGSAYHYYNKWVLSCLCMEDIIESSIYLKSTWNPWTTWSTPFSPQFTGEAAYLASDLPGSSSAPAFYSSISRQDSSSNGWAAYGCNSLQLLNDGSAKRSDGKSWHVTMSATCPAFNVYTG